MIINHLEDQFLQDMYLNGIVAKDFKGNKITLHHLNQMVNGSIIEIPSKFHNISNKNQHPKGNLKGDGLTKKERS